ncbi:HNH endonuclease family protein [Allokutzneria sp. NRRL B-24872]|uniref:HNH endonuclease family protein n=1 Tax=Allokutzneria sp. NRRL B-24872 TaxID=1137961 RepID=UPI001FEFD254|nr:HNH endonuclease family protein [Allokutzneria sp. NRRL B-24872]
MSRGRWILAAVLAVIAIVFGAAAVFMDDPQPSGSGPSTTTAGPAPSGDTAAASKADLDRLSVAAAHAMKGYTREKFKHWITQGEKCDTRETVLKRDGKSVVTDASCKATSGKWVSRYEGKEIAAAGEMDIDHTVPLANAWRSGADTWTDQKRQEFANDLTNPQLLAVSAATNRSKGDQDPSQWKPPAKDAWCDYAKDWIAVKKTYSLNVTDAEKSALRDMLATCK